MNHSPIENFLNVIRRETVNCEECPPLAGLGIREVGVTHVAEGWCFLRVNPKSAFVLLAVQGRGEVMVEGEWKPILPDTAYFMPIDALHGYRAARRNEWKYVWVRLMDTRRFPTLFTEQEAQTAKAASYSLLAGVQGMIDEASRGNNPQLKAIWCELIQHCLYQLTFPTSHDPRLEALWISVSDRLAENWDIANLAKLAHMSREQLRRLCGRYYGCTPHKKLTALRMRRACELLASGQDKLEVVAADVGYSDSFSFSQAFKREMGLAPSSYRETVQKAKGQDREIM